MVLQNYQNFIQVTYNMIYIVAFGSGLKCLRKIYLNAQCPCPSALHLRLYFVFLSHFSIGFLYRAIRSIVYVQDDS